MVKGVKLFLQLTGAAAWVTMWIGGGLLLLKKSIESDEREDRKRENERRERREREAR